MISLKVINPSLVIKTTNYKQKVSGDKEGTLLPSTHFGAGADVDFLYLGNIKQTERSREVCGQDIRLVLIF